MFDEHSTNLDNVIDLLFKLTIFINKSLEKLTYVHVENYFGLSKSFYIQGRQYN